jgi:hypothetical protein
MIAIILIYKSYFREGIFLHTQLSKFNLAPELPDEAAMAAAAAEAAEDPAAVVAAA